MFYFNDEIYLLTVDELKSIPEHERPLLDRIGASFLMHATLHDGSSKTFTGYGFKDPMNHVLAHRFLVLKLME